MSDVSVGALVSRAVARALGRTRYFTGKSCKHGHVAERQTTNGMCYDCAPNNNRRSRVKHAEKVAARLRDYRAAHRDRLREQGMAWREKNVDRRREANKAWYAKNPEKASTRRKAWSEASRVKRAANPDERNAERRENYKRNPEPARARAVARGHDRRVAMRRTRSEDLKRIIRYVFHLRTSTRVRCYWCKEPVKRKERHIDHIVPVIKGGAHAVGNLCLSCRRCNLRKHDKLPEEFSGQGELRFVA